MDAYQPFDLPAFMLANFNGVDFGGDLFGQWPIGIRFEIQTLEISPFDDTPYRLTWTCISSHLIDATEMFQGIAHREQPGDLKIVSAVYLLNPTAKLIIHMYDDRGLDIIATNIETIRPLYEKFDHWVLDNQRHRVAFRFGRNHFET